jgi:hypothetical protein
MIFRQVPRFLPISFFFSNIVGYPIGQRFCAIFFPFIGKLRFSLRFPSWLSGPSNQTIYLIILFGNLITHFDHFISIWIRSLHPLPNGDFQQENQPLNPTLPSRTWVSSFCLCICLWIQNRTPIPLPDNPFHQALWSLSHSERRNLFSSWRSRTLNSQISSTFFLLNTLRMSIMLTNLYNRFVAWKCFQLQMKRKFGPIINNSRTTLFQNGQTRAILVATWSANSDFSTTDSKLQKIKFVWFIMRSIFVN